MTTKRNEASSALNGLLLAVLVVLLALNIVMLARAVDLIRLPGEISELETARKGAYALADQYARIAEQRGLSRNRAVRDELAKFKFEIEQALTPEEIASSIGRYGRNLQDVMAREEENRRREAVHRIINQEPGLQNFQDRATILVRADENGTVEVEDRDDVLSSATEEKLKNDPDVKQLTQLVEVEIQGGKITLLTTRSLSAQIEALRTEVDRLRSSLQETMRTGGYSELSGPGVVIRATTPEGETGGQGQAFLSYDIRDIINELFAAGAAGVEVGGQRVVATTSVRSVGDQILVNQQVISTKPLIIKAVGDPQILETSLDLIKNSPYFGLELEIEEKKSVTLAAYRTRG